MSVAQPLPAVAWVCAPTRLPRKKQAQSCKGRTLPALAGLLRCSWSTANAAKR